MSKQTQNSDKPGNGADAANAAAGAEALTADDLDLISENLEDEVKDDDEIWADIDAEEDAAAKAAATGTDSIEDQLDAGRAAGDAGEAVSDQDDEGEQDDGDADTAADKLWTGASDGQRKAFGAAQAQITKLEQSDRSNRGRVSTLQRQINDITKQFDAAASKDAAAAEDGDSEGTATNAFLDSKAWKDFESEYPEVAGPFGTVVASLQTEIADQGKQLDAIGDDRREDAVAEQTEILEEQHPDWQDAATDDAFGPWLEGQPRHMREAAVRNAEVIVDASEAADVIGRFKAFKVEQSDDSAGPGDDGEGDGPKPEDQDDTVTNLEGKRRRQIEASSGARPKGAGAATGIPEDGDEEAIWDAFDKQEQREARQA